MKTTTPSINSIKAKRALLTGVITALFAVVGLVGLGMKLEAARQPERLPANKACLQALDDASKALKGEPVDLAKSVKDCRVNVDNYQVVMK